MPYHPNPTGAQQRARLLHPDVQRWLRHDAHLWIRPDAARWLKPGTDPADVYPALARQREAEDAAFAAQIAKGYRLLAALREEVASIKADLLRRRLAAQTKYSPAQPRVPAGNPRGGQWTDRSGGGGGFGGFGSGDSTGTEDGGGTDGGEGGGIDEADTGSENLSDSIVKVAAADSERFYTPTWGGGGPRRSPAAKTYRQDGQLSH